METRFCIHHTFVNAEQQIKTLLLVLKHDDRWDSMKTLMFVKFIVE